jgi:hypothetical protein
MGPAGTSEGFVRGGKISASETHGVSRKNDGRRKFIVMANALVPAPAAGMFNGPITESL